MEENSDLKEVEIKKLKLQFKDSFSIDSTDEVSTIYLIKGFKTTDPDFPKKLLPNGINVRIKLTNNFPKNLPKVSLKCEEYDVKIKKCIKSVEARLSRRISLKKHYFVKTGSLRTIFKFLDRFIGEDRGLLNISKEEDVSRYENLHSKEWSYHQQEALEKSLANFPKGQENQEKERWISIAKRVAGKNALDCFERYNFLRAQLLIQQEEQIKAIEIEKITKLKVKSSEKTSEIEVKVKEMVVSKLSLEEFTKLSLKTNSKLEISKLEFKNIAYLEPVGVATLCQCLHCGELFEKVLKVEEEEEEKLKFWCNNKKCGHVLEIDLQSVALHQGNLSSVCVFISTSIVAVDVQLITFLATCFECDTKEYIFNVARGKAKEQSCKSCHKKLWLCFQNIFILGDRKFALNSREYSTKNIKDSRIVQGKPLPNEGTCKHYKKSHRWLRFPCCNRAFPCDVCHDLGTNCIETKRATRHICGYCAKEQPFSNDQPCIKCGKEIGAFRRTSHWEGGKGCRNKKLMSTKDKKKYTDSVNKTISNKQNRVGPKRK